MGIARKYLFCFLFVSYLPFAFSLSSSIVTEIKDHQADADKIIAEAVNGSLKGATFNRLATFTDTFGNRLSGSDSLERSIDYLLDQMKKEGLENVHGETVTVPKWVRGKEYANLLSPQIKPLNMMGLGNSVGTGGKSIIAEAVVVKSFAELSSLPRNATEGKIVVYNQYCDWETLPIVCYGLTVSYRTQGAVNAAKAGAVASLARTVGSFSINSPHTGMMSYSDSVPKIPNACITIEDAEMLERMQARGQNITIELYMEAHAEPDTTSRNVVAEIIGSQYPDQVVIVSGHIDSWDVGQGAMDDGGGAFISWMALSLIHKLGMRPKRTLRCVMWTCEEFGGVGSKQYYEAHKVNASNYDIVMESDLGVFKPLGIEFSGTNKDAIKIMREVTGLLQSINATLLMPGGHDTDNGWWSASGVPLGSIITENDKYFYFHHSNGDTMTVLNPHHMDLAAAVWAVVSYVVADLDQMIPRDSAQVDLYI